MRSEGMGRRETTSPDFGATIQWVALMAMLTWPLSWTGTEPRWKTRSPVRIDSVRQSMARPYWACDADEWGRLIADGLVCAQGESGAVEDVGSGSSPHVRFAELCLRVGDDGRDVGRDLAADTDDPSASGEVAPANREDTAGQLAVGVEPLRLVLADGERVAVFGVGYAVAVRPPRRTVGPRFL